MLKSTKKHFAKYFSVYAASFVFLLVLLIFENLFSNSFRNCVSQYSSSSAAKNTEYGRLAVSIGVSQIACTVHFINFHVGLFSVIAGILVAFFTYNLVDSTNSLWAAGELQRKDTRRAILASVASARAARRSVEIALEEFHATNRPRIRIKHVWPIGRLHVNASCAAEIVFANTGNVPAIITNFGIDFNVIDPDQRMPPNMTPSIGNNIVFGKCGLGQTQKTGILCSLGTFDYTRIMQIEKGEKLLICFGFIEYTDEAPGGLRKTRRTAFSREYVPVLPSHGDGRYAIMKYYDPDYEYED